jgi:uncharacterized protein
MKIGILSDTHNELDNLLAALEVFKKNQIEYLIHCGDLTDPYLVQHFTGFQVIYLLGNLDHETGKLEKFFKVDNSDNTINMLYTGHFDGVSIAAAHGHLEGSIFELTSSGKYAYVFHGHTHRKRDEKIGSTRVINPGALGGRHVEPRSVCMVDFENGDVQFIRITG